MALEFNYDVWRLITPALSWSIGDGRGAWFWKDAWLLNHGRLIDVCMAPPPPKYLHFTVASYRLESGDGIVLHICFLTTVRPPNQYNPPDRFMWWCSDNEWSFSMKSV